MDQRAAISEERAWWRFVARLVAFADLAEQAAHRSAPVRWLVLWILRHAEMVMADYVFDTAGLPPPPLEDIEGAGYRPEDALALAARFMALAAMLAGLIRATDWNDRWPASRRAMPTDRASRPTSGGWTQPPNDTS